MVFDSCVWIEWFTDGPNADAYTDAFADLGQIVVPTIVVHEVTKWIRKHRREEDVDRAMALMLQGQVRPMDEVIAEQSSALAVGLQLPSADAIVLAHARVERVELLTQDQHFKDLDGVRYVEPPTVHPDPSKRKRRQ